MNRLTSVDGQAWAPPAPAAASATVIRALVLLLAYAGTAYLGLQWGTVNGAASPVWPAAGIGLAALVLWHKRLWPAITIGTLIAYQLNGASNPLLAQLAAALGNGLATLFAAAVFHRYAGRRWGVFSLQQLLSMVAASFLLGSVSALIGVGTLLVTGSIAAERVLPVLTGWLLGDAAGALVIGALLLSWRSPGEPPITAKQLLLMSAICALTALVAAGVFLGPAIANAWMIYPVLVWAAVALRVRGAAVAVFITMVVAVAGVSLGRGPFVSEGVLFLGPSAGIALLQLFILVSAGTILVLAAIADERRQEEEKSRLTNRAMLAQRAARCSAYEFNLETGQVSRDPFVFDETGHLPGDVKDLMRDWEAIIHPDDLDEFRHTVVQAKERAERYAMEYRVICLDGSFMWIRDTGEVVRDASGTAIRLVGLASDVTERRESEEELRRTTSMLQLIGDSAGGLIFAKDRQGRYIYHNEQVARIIGRPLSEQRGKDDRDWAEPALAELYMANDRRVMETGVAEEIDEEAMGPDGSPRLYRSIKAPLRDPDGEVIGIVGVATDITDRKAAEDREQLLAREADHRAKNLLAVVQSVVQMSRADSVESFKAGVTGRIQALARAHSLLAATRWEGVELGQLVRDELAPFITDDPSRVRIKGPSLRLGPAAGQSIALVLHELATNAAKYGSLSTHGGRLAVGWTRSRRKAAPIRLEWQEEGGPRATPPSRAGFGSRLIRVSVERQLGGELAFDWSPDGLAVQLLIPAEHVLASRKQD